MSSEVIETVAEDSALKPANAGKRVTLIPQLSVSTDDTNSEATYVDDKKSNKRSSNRMAQQASKVLKYLQQIEDDKASASAGNALSQKKPLLTPVPIPKDAARSINEIARIAKQKLRNPSPSRNLHATDTFVNYDPLRSGRVDVADLNDVLVHSSAGLSTKEIRHLGERLDAEHTGQIEYKNILHAIESLCQIPPAEEVKPQAQLDNTKRAVAINLPSSEGQSITEGGTSIDNSARTSHNLLSAVMPPPAPSVEPSYSAGSFMLDSNHQQQPLQQGDHILKGIERSYKGDFVYPNRRHLFSSAGHRAAPFHEDLTEEDRRRASKIQHMYRARHRSSSAPPRYVNTIGSDESSSEGVSESKAGDHAADSMSRRGRNPSNGGPSNKKHFRNKVSVSELLSPSAYPGTEQELLRTGIRTILVPQTFSFDPWGKQQLESSGAGDVANFDYSLAPSSTNDGRTSSGNSTPRRFTYRASYGNDVDHVSDLMVDPPTSTSTSFADASSSTSAVRTAAASLHPSVEKSVIAQVKGRVSGFRHALRQHDVSDSGVVNFDELSSACKKFGVRLPKDKLKNLFDSFARHSPTRQRGESKPFVDIGFTGGEAVDIESLVDHISRHSEVDKPAEEKRVCRKVLHSAARLTDPMLIFKNMNPNFRGFVNEAELKEGIRHMGAVLSDHEFGLLMDTIKEHGTHSSHSDYSDTRNGISGNNAGSAETLIHVADLNNVLHKHVNQSDREDLVHRQMYTDNKHNDTFKVHREIAVYDHYEFKDITRSSKSYSLEQYKTNKLKENLRSKHGEQLLKCFQPNESKSLGPGEETKEAEALSVDELSKRMDHFGVLLGDEDKHRYRDYLHQYQHNQQQQQGSNPQSLKSSLYPQSNGEARLTLDSFCDAMGMNILSNPQRTIELQNQLDTPKHGGIFSGAHKSQNSHPTFATSVLVTDSETAEGIKGQQRRKPARLPYPHITDPSRFWEMSHTDENLLMPMPLGLVKDWPSYPSSSKTNPPFGFPSRQAQSSQHDALAGSGYPGRTGKPSGLRSRSAPPRRSTTSLSGSEITSNASHNSHTIITDHPQSYGNASKSMECVFKWGSKSLADFMANQNVGINANTQHPQPTMQVKQIPQGISSASAHPSGITTLSGGSRPEASGRPSTVSITSNSWPTKAELNSNSSIGKQSRTLRRQLRSGDTSSAPFALDS